MAGIKKLLRKAKKGITKPIQIREKHKSSNRRNKKLQAIKF